MITLKVNGTQHQLDIEPETPLLWVMRDELGLTGTKFGCGIAQCGACTVHVDGEATRSCSVPVGAVDGKEITTIEGLSHDSKHPVQRGLDRRGRAAMRLLPVGPDHGGGRAAQAASPADRRRHRRRHDQHLPLRHLSADPRGDPSRRRDDEGLRRTAMDGSNIPVSRRQFIVTSADRRRRLRHRHRAPAGALPIAPQPWSPEDPDAREIERLARHRARRHDRSSAIRARRWARAASPRCR